MEAKPKGNLNNNQQHKSTMKASNSGIVIQEASGTTNISGDLDDNLNPQEVYKRDADQYMPIANVTKIMRRILPPHAKIADDAKETIQECVSEFISFITAEANEKCHQEYRKTITPQDVISAMASLGFNDYIDPLSVYYTKIQNQDKEVNSMLPFQSTKRNASFLQPKINPMIPRTPQTNHAPPAGAYNNSNRDYYVGVPQMSNYSSVNNAGGHGEGSSNNLGFNP